jgi:hypothetical protein
MEGEGSDPGKLMGLPREVEMDQMELTAEQEAQAARIEDVILAGMRAEVRTMARFRASRQDGELLGASEFLIRDRCHALGARVIDAALSERKKGGTVDQAGSARAARKTRSSRDTGR